MKKALFAWSIFTLLFLSCFSGDDDDISPYKMIIKGYEGGTLTTFTGNYLLLDGTENWHSYRIIADSLVVELDDSGTYILTATKSGYLSDPEIDTVHITDLNPTGRPTFYFTEDTATTNIDYYVTVSGTAGGSNTSFEGEYKWDSPDSSWHIYSVGSSGSTTLPMPGPGSYLFTANKAGHSVSPSEASVTLNEAAPEDEVNFTFTDTTGSTTYYTLNINGTLDGAATSFTAEYRHSSTSAWSSIAVGSSGATSLTFETSGTYYIRAFRVGCTAEPEVDTVYLGYGAEEVTSSFEFTEIVIAEFHLTIEGSSEGAPIPFTARYKQDMPGALWQTVAVGASGSYIVTLDYEGTYFVEAEKDGFTASPIMDTVYLGTGSEDVTSSFTFTEVTEPDYSLTVMGSLEEGDTPTSFTAQYRLDVTGSSWTSVAVGATGIRSISLPSAGTYIVRAEKDGYVTDPETQTVTVNESAPSTSASFSFSIEDPGDYSLIIMGSLDEGGAPTSFTAEYRLEGASWTSVAVGSSGIVTLPLTTAGTYYVRASKEGYVSTPETNTVTISTATPSATAVFSFEEDTGEEYYIHFIGEIGGARTSFTGRWRRDVEGAEWHDIAVGSSGTASATVTVAGRYVVHAVKDGYYADEQVIELGPTNPYEYVTFDFEEELDEYYIHFIGELDGVRTSFTGRYKRDLAGEEWHEITIGGSGTASATVYSGGTYRVQGIKTGCYAEEQTVTLNASSPYEYVTFEFVDTTGMEFYIHLIGEILGTGVRTNFTAVWRPDVEGEAWTSVDVGGSGTVSVRVPGPGTYAVVAQKEACITTPDTAYVTLSIDELYDYVNFYFNDTTGTTTHGIEIYLTDSYNYRVVKFNDMTCDGWVDFGTHGTGIGEFNYTWGIFYHEETDQIYLTEHGGRIIRMDNMYGSGWISYDGSASPGGRFDVPGAIQIGPDNKIYIADVANSRFVRINNMDGDGWTEFGEYGSGAGQFDWAPMFDFDDYGRIYIVDSRNHRIVRIDNMSGTGWTTFGGHGSGVGQFDRPYCITIGHDNKIYVVDRENRRIVRLDDMSGAGWTEFSGPFTQPLLLRTDSDGRIYVADHMGHTLWRMNSMAGDGLINFGNYGSGDCQFNRPFDIYIRETE